MPILVPNFLYSSSLPYFAHPIGYERLVLVGASVLKLQFSCILLDFFLCLFLRQYFLTSNTNTDPERTTRPARPWYTFSLLTSDYPGRWFLLHAVWNVGITIACLPDVWFTILHPNTACEPSLSYNLMPTLMSMALHLYHVIAPWFWIKLTKEDIFHHLVFAIGGLGSISVLWSWGPGANFAFIFLTGLPGGLDYLMLGLIKLGLMEKLTEKSINSKMNAWIRGPGCTAAAVLTYAAWHGGKMGPPTAAVALNIGLIFYNGNYYSQRVIANEAKCRTLSKLAGKKK